MSKTRILSRRTVLRGGAVAIGLPLLEQMTPPARAATTRSPLRFLAFFCPNGFIKEAWLPVGTGSTFTLGPTMEPLAPVKDDLLIVSGVGKDARGTNGCYRGAYGHENGTGGMLTGVFGISSLGKLDPGAVSVDQMIANAIGNTTKFKSIQTQVMETGGHNRLHRHISWASDNTPLANEKSPKALFDRLFTGFVPADDATAQASAAKLRRLEASVLDFVIQDAGELKGRLGRSDNLKLDEYLTSVRDLERRVQSTDSAFNPTSCRPVSPAITKDARQTVKDMLDVLVLALQCDATRVATFMLENGLGEFVFDFLGQSMGHHALSHHSGNKAMIEGCKVIEKWEMEQFSYLLQKMKAVKEPDGTTLLDNSIVFLQSDVGDGMGHTAFDLKVLIAGKGQGAIKTGRHVQTISKDKYGGDCSVVPVGNVFISLLAAYGVTVDKVGPYSTGPFTALSG